MTHVCFRDKWRVLRLYYKKSMPLLFSTLTHAYRALWFPFWGSGRFRSVGGVQFQVPRQYWFMLPTACRLLHIGAVPEWVGDDLVVRFHGLILRGPATQQTIHTFLREIFVNDVYRLVRASLSNTKVLDVGANIGDSSIAYARAGARVYAFEPMPRLFNYLRENIAINQLQDRVTVYPVGLAVCDDEVEIPIPADEDIGFSMIDHVEANIPRRIAGQERIKLVAARPFLESQGIRHVDVLKLDCEGCEYDLLGKAELIEFLKPNSVVVEYHKGPDLLTDVLRRNGYEIEIVPDDNNRVGYIYASRGD